jgi:hypothetical protein
VGKVRQLTGKELIRLVRDETVRPLAVEPRCRLKSPGDVDLVTSPDLMTLPASASASSVRSLVGAEVEEEEGRG